MDRAYHDTYYVLPHWPYLATLLVVGLGLWALWNLAILRLASRYAALKRPVLTLYALGAVLMLAPFGLPLLAEASALDASRWLNLLTVAGALLAALAIAASLAIFVLAGIQWIRR